jgi:hypothetical protein
MINKDISKENIGVLRDGFKKYLAEHYSQLSYHDVICSDAFLIFREDIGIRPEEIFELSDGLQRCKEKLKVFFANINRKNPLSDAHTYGRAIKLLKEYVCVDVTLQVVEKEKATLYRAVRSGKRRDDIPRPCEEEIIKYLTLWGGLEDYRIQEEALDKLFIETYPKNSNIHDVVIKVSALNDFYSTNIFKPYKVAKHIVELNIDSRLAVSDISLVNEIAVVEMDNRSVKNFYSFATKYCSRHRPLDYPIYDSFVDRLLRYFRDSDGFASFNNEDLKNNVIYKDIIFRFGEFYGLQKFNLKQIDKYLWQLGKEKFPKKY